MSCFRRRCALLIGLVWLASCCHSGAPATQSWSRIATMQGTIDIPAGWHLLVTRGPVPIFRMYSPDDELQVHVLAIRTRAYEPRPLDSIQRQLRDVGAPSELVLADAGGEWYGEVEVRPGRVFAACASVTTLAHPRPVLALATNMDQGHVSRARFAAAGGRALLCAIAASVTDLPLDD